MAKYTKRFKGDFDHFLKYIENSVMEKSITASFEDSSGFKQGNCQVAIRVYERYSYFGGNRVSMNITLVGVDEDLFVSCITSGGSTATFFKINTFGESSFLETFESSVNDYIRENSEI